MPRQAQIKTRRNNSRVPKPSPAETNRRTAEDEKDIRDARRALKEARKKGSVAWEEVKREVGI
jgi:RNA polymerase-interacting CarD/CdnL/TRCF family regulator